MSEYPVTPNVPVFFRPDDLTAAYQAIRIELPEWQVRLEHAYQLLWQANYVRLEWAGDVLLFSAITGNTYAVTPDTCTCAAYVLPTQAGDPPKKCKHRAAYRMLARIRDDAKARRVAAMQADMAAGQLPACLAPVGPVILPAGAATVMDPADWLDHQVHRLMGG